MITPDFLNGLEADRLLDELLERTPWSALSTVADGTDVAPTRLICWVGDTGYDFYGAHVHAHPWTPVLAALRGRLEVATGGRYDSVLLNLYRDGRDFVDWHADDERALGDRPMIASLSLGSVRRFLMRHNATREVLAVELEHGSLVVMHGDAQSAWQHAVPQAKPAIGPRVNLTFRWFRPDGEPARREAEPRLREEE